MQLHVRRRWAVRPLPHERLWRQGSSERSRLGDRRVEHRRHRRLSCFFVGQTPPAMMPQGPLPRLPARMLGKSVDARIRVNMSAIRLVASQSNTRDKAYPKLARSRWRRAYRLREPRSWRRSVLQKDRRRAQIAGEAWGLLHPSGRVSVDSKPRPAP